MAVVLAVPVPFGGSGTTLSILIMVINSCPRNGQVAIHPSLYGLPCTPYSIINALVSHLISFPSWYRMKNKIEYHRLPVGSDSTVIQSMRE